jgi:Skp family chaperone for outer membrane proteins
MTLSLVSFAAALMSVGQQDSFGTTRVAVVNLPAVSEAYLKTGELEAQFEQRRVKFNQERDALRERVERTGKSLQEELKPGTKEYEERRKQFALLEAELQWFVDNEGQKIEEGLAASLRSIYADIQAVVREVAEEMRIDVVLAADQLPNEVPKSTTQVRQQIVLHKVVYFHPRADLTNEVITRLNAKHKARAATPP